MLLTEALIARQILVVRFRQMMTPTHQHFSEQTSSMLVKHCTT